MKTVKLFTMLFLALGVMLVSCEKEGSEGPQGEIGPSGPVGADGADGADGAQGEQGEKGDVGNANVIVSGWIESTFSDTAVYSQSQEVFDDSIAADVIDGGLLLGYGRSGADGNPNRFAINLPYLTGEKNYTCIARIGSIIFQGRRTGATSQIFRDFTAFRYVLIPSNSTSKVAQPNFKKMSYEEVMDHFGLDY